MDKLTRENLADIYSGDKAVQTAAYYFLMEATEKPVDWSYEVWDKMVETLGSPDNHQRAIAAQVLCNLARWSDPANRIQTDFPALLNVTKDARFVTARHCLQNLWKVGAAGKAQQQLLVDGLASRFNECGSEKNGSLIRNDIIEDFKKLYDLVKDETLREKALALIETAPDQKYRQKYAAVWRDKKQLASK